MSVGGVGGPTAFLIGTPRDADAPAAPAAESVAYAWTKGDEVAAGDASDAGFIDGGAADAIDAPEGGGDAPDAPDGGGEAGGAGEAGGGGEVPEFRDAVNALAGHPDREREREEAEEDESEEGDERRRRRRKKDAIRRREREGHLRRGSAAPRVVAPVLSVHTLASTLAAFMRSRAVAGGG